MHYFYIIYSEQVDRFYLGETSDITLRLEKHNSNHYHQAYTKIANDWKYVLIFKTETRTDALLIESFVKRMKSVKFIQKIISNQNILHDILKKK